MDNKSEVPFACCGVSGGNERTRDGDSGREAALDPGWDIAFDKALPIAPPGVKLFFRNNGGIGSCLTGPGGAAITPLLSLSKVDGSSMLTLTLAKGPPDPFWAEPADDSGTGTFPCPNIHGPPPYFFFSNFFAPNFLKALMSFAVALSNSLTTAT